MTSSQPKPHRRKYRHYMMGVGFAAFSAAAFAASPSSEEMTSSSLSPTTQNSLHIGAGPIDEENRAIVDTSPQSRFVLGAALASLVGGAVGFFGLHRIAGAAKTAAVKGGRQLAKVTKGAINAPLKVVKVMATSAGKTLKKPIRFLGVIIGIGLLLLSSFFILNIEWQAGLVMGILSSLFVMGGFHRLRASRRKACPGPRSGVYAVFGKSDAKSKDYSEGVNINERPML